MFDVQSMAASGPLVSVYLRIENTVRKNGRPIKTDAVHFWTFNERGQIGAIATSTTRRRSPRRGATPYSSAARAFRV